MRRCLFIFVFLLFVCRTCQCEQLNYLIEDRTDNLVRFYNYIDGPVEVICNFRDLLIENDLDIRGYDMGKPYYIDNTNTWLIHSNLFRKEFDAFILDIENCSIIKTLKVSDENSLAGYGNIEFDFVTHKNILYITIMFDVLDENGEPILDEDGHYIYKKRTNFYEAGTFELLHTVEGFSLLDSQNDFFFDNTLTKVYAPIWRDVPENGGTTNVGYKEADLSVEPPVFTDIYFSDLNSEFDNVVEGVIRAKKGIVLFCDYGNDETGKAHKLYFYDIANREELASVTVKTENELQNIYFAMTKIPNLNKTKLGMYFKLWRTDVNSAQYFISSEDFDSVYVRSDVSGEMIYRKITPAEESINVEDIRIKDYIPEAATKKTEVFDGDRGELFLNIWDDECRYKRVFFNIDNKQITEVFDENACDPEE